MSSISRIYYVLVLQEDILWCQLNWKSGGGVIIFESVFFKIEAKQLLNEFIPPVQWRTHQRVIFLSELHKLRFFAPEKS